MKLAEFSQHEYISGKRHMCSIWLKVRDGSKELFYGPVTKYRIWGWERCVVQLMMSSMKVALTLAGYEVKR